MCERARARFAGHGRADRIRGADDGHDRAGDRARRHEGWQQGRRRGGHSDRAGESVAQDRKLNVSSSGKSVGKQARGTRARSIARKLAMQALYQWQLTQQTAAEIKKQFLESEDSAGVDREHFEELVSGCIAKNEEL